MDDRTEQIVEQRKQRELLYNERIVEHPAYGAIRLRRPTQEEEALIAEIRNKRYLTDLFDDNIKSKDEIEQRAIARGMWSTDTADRINSLVQQVGMIMSELDRAGFKTLPEVLQIYSVVADKLKKQFEDDEDILPVLAAYCNIAEKGSLADRTAITDAAPSTVVDDLLDELDSYRSQMDMLTDFATLKKELQALQEKQAELFMGSLESRADREERLATMYYCCKLADSDKHVWKSIADMKKARPEDVEYVLSQWQYFANGIDPAFEASLEKYGFSRRLVTTDDSSDASPDQPQSNSDGESVEKTQLTSSAVTESTTESSTTPSSTSSTGSLPTAE